MNILDNMHSPEDVRALEAESLPRLCAEIREFLISSIADTGGHLASNLGTVELTVAIHRVFDTAVDRLVFDVGHQSYTHKLLTGRREEFSTLRQYGGISGFPKPNESVHDAFIAGHASSSVSTALGMAHARSAAHASYSVLAMLGDGALTGGLAYEGLCNAGSSGEPMIVILNDNGMSIAQNVGGIASLLANHRVKPSYLSFKRLWRRTVGRIKPLYRFAHRVKEWIKDLILGDNMFEEFGFYYLGPVDGHDITALETVLRWARDMGEPVLVHVTTEKGHGYAYAEQSPDAYHGVGPFDSETGELKAAGEDFSTVFGEALTTLAARDRRISAITAAMAGGTGLAGFSRRFPERFFDVGIAEGHAVSMAAGMAKQGQLPVFAVYSSFLQRGYDMLIHDLSLLQLHVILGVDRAGLVGRDGETHHGVFDLAYLGSVPGMTVLCPASFAELRDMLKLAIYSVPGAVALRYPRGGEGEYRLSAANEPVSVVRQGRHITILTHGIMINQAIAAARLLDERGISAELVKINQAAPLDTRVIAASVRKTNALLCVEDVCDAGSMGERTLSALAHIGAVPDRVLCMNLGDGLVTHGAVSELLCEKGLDAPGIARSAMVLLGIGGETYEKKQA